MPGLNQLKKFSDDTRNLGNELKEHEKRGEPVINIPFPEGISEADDSDDFLMGLPVEEEEQQADSQNDDASLPDELSDLVGATSGSGIPDPIPDGDASNTDNIDLSGLDPELAKFFMSDPAATGETTATGETAATGESSATGEPSATTETTATTEPAATGESATSDVDSDLTMPEDLLSELTSEAEKAPDTSNTSSDDDIEELEELEELDDLEEVPSEDIPDIEEENETQNNASSGNDFDMPDVSQVPEGEPVLPPLDDTDTSMELPPLDEQAPDMELPPLDDVNSSEKETLSQEDFSMPDYTASGLPEMTDSNELEEPSSDSVPEPESESVEDFSDAIPSDSFEFDKMGESKTDDGDDQFSIPGFSDFALEGDAGDSSLSVPDFSKATSASPKGEKLKNAITDADYKLFLDNIHDYPLNLRIVIEDFVVKNEFTDEVTLEVIEKVVKRVPARQLASHLEKLLDTTISIPRDFERRTVAQYEAYKSSIQYQLKNRIIPGLIVCAALALIGVLLFIFINRFVYRPILADSLYKEGYNLLENSMYPQSEVKFSEAVAVKPKKQWFFKYARAYRERKQYDRARTFYERLLERFDYDKDAGLEYANMEFLDLSNYEKAEEITRRKILDYHINDKDALLLLGDIFLEWGTEKDSAKLSDAFQTYNELIELYGNTDLYSSRLMRYYIRTDNLREVLSLKSYFYEKKNALEAEDLVELSGYLLDKLYGELPVADEYLRTYIEDVRELLNRAITADPTIPEGQYNWGRYFLYTGNNTQAESIFNTALDAFNNATTRKPKRIRKQIDTYRMLGELYAEQSEYLLAEETYGNGIALYETEAADSGFKSDSIVGNLYADMADIDYFISGDMDNAFRNYNNAIKNDYDTPSVNYRIGYINYNKKDYSAALSSFIKTISKESDDRHVLLALGNVLSLRQDNYAAQGYYEQLITLLDAERVRYGIMFPQVREDQADIVDLCLKAENNLGVTLNRLAVRTGDSAMNAEAIVHLSESLRAWDALTRNQDTMVRLEGSNLAEQNIKYISYPHSDYESAIYTAIPSVLVGEKRLEQPAAR